MLLRQNIALITRLDILDCPVYCNNIQKLGEELPNLFFVVKMNKIIATLQPVHAIRKFSSDFSGCVGDQYRNHLSTTENNIDFYHGNFKEIIARGTTDNLAIIVSIQALLRRDEAIAIKLFDDQLKVLRKEFRAIQIFLHFSHNYFYFIAILCLDTNELAVRVQKIYNHTLKNNYSEENNYLKAIFRFTKYSQRNEQKCKITEAEMAFYEALRRQAIHNIESDEGNQGTKHFENTIEEKIIKLHNTKRDLAESLLEGSDQSAKMSVGELVSLLHESV
ncbi:MAG: hypothetical protein AUK44_10055 [Porphyromonadaceae bacterium CG2_30_38_12]|nr:MAG: hypothetical protein AUK44_10055 [Porphyromonadaceae bacterium CG2_30_38_12]